MKIKKLNLSEIKVEGFATSVETANSLTINGGRRDNSRPISIAQGPEQATTLPGQGAYPAFTRGQTCIVK